MNSTINSHPEGECPHCGSTISLGASDMPDEGDEIECEVCEKTMFVSGVDWTVTVTLSTEEPK